MRHVPGLPAPMLRLKHVTALVVLVGFLSGTAGVADAATAHARSGSHTTRSTRSSSSSKPKASTPHPSRRSQSAHARDDKGRIARSEVAKHDFMANTGYPHGRRGYVVDHITPLACGGADTPSNMQWQTVEAAKAKDKVERRGCH